MATTTKRSTAPTTRTRKPANAKAPQDHKPAAPAKGKVTPLDNGDRKVELDGLELVITKESADDFELLDIMARAEREQNPALLPELLRRLVGVDGYTVVLDHLRDKDSGRVQVQPAIQFINRLLASLNPNS